MIRLKSVLCFICFALYTLNAVAQYGPPPRNLQFDSLTLIATWEPPISTLLSEHFEGAVFPPQNWQDTTRGMGWFATTNGSSPSLNIPPHSTYAVVNNSLAGSGNNGCCDYLITPEMDLTQAEGYTLSFNSFFRGLDTETASVEISTDGGTTWVVLLDVLPHFAWANLTADLSFISGPGGAKHVKIAFKANDNGNPGATGWAVDDVMVVSEGMQVQAYGLFWDGTEVGQTGDTTITFNMTWFPSGMPPDFCISAIYDSGMSVFVCADFPAYYLAPPTNLEAVATTTSTSFAAILSWEPPVTGDYMITGSTPRTCIQNTESEYSPQLATYTGNRNSNAIWDELFVYQSDGQGQAGVETDGNYIYTSVWSSDLFYKYDLLGNLVESFTISGVSAIRDMAFDGQYFYGSAANSVLFKMDFTNKTLVSTINTGVVAGIRHIAYDAGLDGGNGGFWCGSWSSLSCIKMNGSLIQDVYSFNLAMCYGSAVDPVNHKLWFHDQGGMGITLWEFDIATLAFTGVSYQPDSLTGFQQYTGIAGGLAFTDKVVAGKWVLMGLVQQPVTLIYGLDMTAITPPAAELLSYNIYRDNEFLTNVPGTSGIYWDLDLEQGTYNYQVSALYDLTPLGFPGQVGESVRSAEASVDIYCCSLFPFMEDWSTGQFDVNRWDVGPDWILDDANGNQHPTSKFIAQSQLSNYSSKLVSFGHHADVANSTTPFCIWLDFDFLLNDNTASGTEKLTIEVSDGDSWIPVQEFANNGDIGWTQAHINITSTVRNKLFKVRFIANGLNSADINYWMVDNIHIYAEYSFLPPANFIAASTGNPQANEVALAWDLPIAENLIEVILDDSTFENSLGINPGYQGWLGNKFNAGKGNLRAVEIFWWENSGAILTPVFLDVFDANHNLAGSSAEFIPVPGTWQLVEMPDIALDGDFYTMVRFERLPGTTPLLGMDSTTNSGRPNTGWYFDGSAWSQMNSFGFNECTFSVRAVVRKEVDCENNIIEKSAIGNYVAFNQTVSQVNKSAAGANGLQTFDVYRREYQVPVPGQDSLLTNWQRIATLNANSYLDQNLAYKCYQYYVEAFYDEGSSAPSNTDEACFLVGMDDLKQQGVTIYPNPARDFVTIQFAGQIERITIYNATGAIVKDLPVTIESTQRLNVSGFAPGVYTLRFTTQKGETIHRKFVKM